MVQAQRGPALDALRPTGRGSRLGSLSSARAKLRWSGAKKTPGASKPPDPEVENHQHWIGTGGFSGSMAQVTPRKVVYEDPHVKTSLGLCHLL